MPQSLDNTTKLICDNRLLGVGAGMSASAWTRGTRAEIDTILTAEQPGTHTAKKDIFKQKIRGAYYAMIRARNPEAARAELEAALDIAQLVADIQTERVTTRAAVRAEAARRRQRDRMREYRARNRTKL